jgi:hypothetical protein
MKQQKQVIVLCVLAAVAALVWYEERSDSAGSASPASIAQTYPMLSIENPEIRWDELERAQRTEYKSIGRNPFSKQAPAPATVAQGQGIAKPKDPRPFIGPQKEPDPPPFVPPTNVKFFGYGTVPNGSSRRAFFSDGEEVYIVSEGETFLGRYRVVKVNNTNLEIEEVSSGRRATMPLVEEPAAAGGPA